MSVRIDRLALGEFFGHVHRRQGRGRLYLLGETSQLHAGLRDWATQVEAFAEGGNDLGTALAVARDETGISLIEEHPRDVIPLPRGYRERARPAGWPGEGLELLHFDPYSMAYRYLARGDEPDYHVVLVWLEAGWLTMERMDSLLQDLLPRFNDRTIRQDPAEFRRKYKGLTQMWRARQPRRAR